MGVVCLLVLVLFCGGCAVESATTSRKTDSSNTGGAVDLEPSRITLDVKDAPLSKVLDALAEQSGNDSLDCLDLDVRGRSVTLTVTDVPYWQAVDKLCKASGLVYGVHTLDGVGFTGLQEGKADDRLQAFSGALLIRLQEAKLRQGVQPGEDPAVECGAAVYWEIRLPVTDIALQIEKAVTDGGVVLEEARVKALPPVPVGPNFKPESASFAVVFPGVPRDSRKLSEVSGRVELGVAESRKRFVIPEVFSSKDLSAGDKHRTIKITRIDRTETGTRMTIVLAGEDLPIFSCGCAEFLQPTLVDPEGNELITWPIALTYAPGTEVTPPDGRGPDGWRKWEVEVLFKTPPDPKGAWSLVWICPTRTKRRTYRFMLKDTPLP